MSDFIRSLKIVELASVLAGPSAGMFFAELGAEVIKIENKRTGGDVTRRWKLASEGQDSNDSAYYHSVNYGKQTIFLDLKDDADREKAYELIKDADVVITNYKPGSASRIGMSWEDIKKINPQVIYANITAYGEDDPRPGFDAMMQAETGWLYMNGQKDGPPTKVPLAIVDILAGHQLKEGILVALLNKMKTGKGCYVTVSLYDASLSAMINQASSYLNLGIIPERKGSQHPNIAPYGDIVTTSDGVSYLLAIGTDMQFLSFCEALDHPDLGSDPKFSTNTQRVDNRVELMDILNELTGDISSELFQTKCDQKAIPIGEIRNLSEVFQDKKAKELILSELNEIGQTRLKVKSAVFKIIKE